MTCIVGGIDRQKLDEVLIRLGGKVATIRRTGEIYYSHPLLDDRPRANGRRKDAPRHLVAFVRKVERVLDQLAHEDRAA